MFPRLAGALADPYLVDQLLHRNTPTLFDQYPPTISREHSQPINGFQTRQKNSLHLLTRQPFSVTSIRAYSKPAFWTPPPSSRIDPKLRDVDFRYHAVRDSPKYAAIDNSTPTFLFDDPTSTTLPADPSRISASSSDLPTTFANTKSFPLEPSSDHSSKDDLVKVPIRNVHVGPSSTTPPRVSFHSATVFPSNLSSDASTPPQPTALPHLTPTSEIHVVSIGDKVSTRRAATAVGHVLFSNASPLSLIRENMLKKGDVLAVARVAGIMAAKKTSEWVPLCHNGVGLESIRINVEVVGSQSRVSGMPQELGELREATSEGQKAKEQPKRTRIPVLRGEVVAPRVPLGVMSGQGLGQFGGVRITVAVQCEGKTGVEMEATTGVVGAALTVVDMCKGVDRGVRIEGVRCVKKEGGRSGKWKEEGW